MTSYTQQVSKEHYQGKAYRSQERWDSYFHQLALVRHANPATVLEIGPGEGVVTAQLRREGMTVTTLDIAADLHPDVVGSVTAIPLPDASFDAVVCAEVLEHISFEDVPTALAEIARVCRSSVIIGLPHPGYVFSVVFKLPLVPRTSWFFQVPFFWKTHTFNGEHYWELGKRGYPLKRFLAVAQEAGLTLVTLQKHADDPAHRFFLFRKG